MSKNIILFSDGTGNKGGHGADTNVFLLFNAVNIHDADEPQISFYDDGVGTSKNRYLRAISGAFGFGFMANVRDLYEYLARYYEPGDDNKPGDKVFLFGFSRGAATIRAFAGMIQECGLLDIKNPACQKDGKFDEVKFQQQIDLEMEAYKKIKTNKSLASTFRARSVKHSQSAPDGALKIEMIGVWDTVSALGFPKDWSLAFDWIFKALDKLTDSLFPHNFYNYQLNKNVEYVYHALAIDDERRTFRPRVWNEDDDDRPKRIEQVWFAGVHSNVGGGYPRAGISMVALDWMMERAVERGVRLNKGVHDEVRASANVDGRLYDSRSGAAIYYRYGPRDITKLCKHIPDPVKIHDSVIDRITKGTSRYAPRSIPYEIEIVHTKIDGDSQPIKAAETKKEYDRNRREIWKWIAWRKRLHRVFIESTLLLLVGAAYLWITMSLPKCASDGTCGHVAEIMFYFLPKFFDGFTTYFAIMHPYYLLAIVAYFGMLRILRKLWRGKTHVACERARQSLLKQISRDDARASDGSAS
ncbi:MAG: DUF2235 domain-containing protein [Proteobacteria bacterium]|nr:DUF2235 domain-containing protein [Pseudomonadota bacterium]